MATSIAAQNPFDPQPKSVTNPGIIGGAITNVAQGNAANSTTAPSQYNPVSGLNIQQYTAQERNVDKATETAAGQLDSILAQDSPLMRRARTIASQNMNQRGLVNSSMAQGAGVAAMIDRATPIAQQDAETYSNRALANMGAVNTANQFNVGQNNALVGQGMGIAADFARQKDAQTFQAGESALERTQQTNLQKAQQTFTAAESALARAQEVALQDKSIKAQQDLQKAQQVFTAAESSLDRAQQAALQKSQQDFTATQNALQITAQKELQTAQQTFQAAESKLDRATQTALADKSIEAQKALQIAQQEFSAAQAVLDRAQQGVIADKQITAQQTLQTAQQTFQATQSQLDRDNAASLAKLQANINASNANDALKAQIALTTLNTINQIALDPNLDATSKQTAIANVTAAQTSTLNYANTLYNTSVGSDSKVEKPADKPPPPPPADKPPPPPPPAAPTLNDYSDDEIIAAARNVLSGNPGANRDTMIGYATANGLSYERASRLADAVFPPAPPWWYGDSAVGQGG